LKPYELSIVKASSNIRDGSLSPVDLAGSLLNRIDEVEPRLEAWVTVNRDQVMKDAEESTRKLLEGSPKSGVHGIPVGVKDIYFTKGLKTTMGSPIYGDYVPTVDANMVTTIKEAGGIVLGKTETTEFALHDPAPTRNPWNTGHTPGGSSSGSAAAVASGMCQVAFGSQTGGSVIRPASYCGIVGVKPTYDLLSRENVYPLSWSLDHIGYMTRTTQDAHIMLEALTGIKKEWHPRVRAPKVGLLAGYFKEKATEEVWQGFEKAVAEIWGEGADVETAVLPESFSLVPDVHRVIMSVETAAVHEDMFKKRGDDYRSYMRGFISSGLLVPATAYLRAQRLRTAPAWSNNTGHGEPDRTVRLRNLPISHRFGPRGTGVDWKPGFQLTLEPDRATQHHCSVRPDRGRSPAGTPNNWNPLHRVGVTQNRSLVRGEIRIREPPNRP